MNLRWNQELCRFEAQLGSGGFKADLAAVQAAKFKCDGPPTWTWYSAHALPLKYLREHRPPVLTIEAEARAQYERLLPIEEKNAEVRAKLAEEKKVIKKQQAKIERQEALVEIKIPEKGYIGVEDLPPALPFKVSHQITPQPHVLCFVCGAPTYTYEYPEGMEHPACLYCQKIVLDNAEEVC
jgi:hypothetical protein